MHQQLWNLVDPLNAIKMKQTEDLESNSIRLQIPEDIIIIIIIPLTNA